MPKCKQKPFSLLPGWGAVFNTVKMEPEKSVVVFGLGALGLSVIQAAKIAGARLIVGVDMNDAKFDAARSMGATECVNPTSCPNNDVKTWLLNKEKWGYDYTFDCTGNVEVMRCEKLTLKRVIGPLIRFS